MSATATEVWTVETRSGDGYQIADVNYPKRVVTVVAMPYEQPTEIIEGGKVFTEIVSRSAFDGIEKRTGKVRANRDHLWDRAVGKLVALHPSRKEGLVAEVKISQTPLGDETLALCDDDVLSASAGFGLLRRDDGRVWDDAEVWERGKDRVVRRLNRLWLDHVAFVPDPAYAGAGVLAVRNTPEPSQVQPSGTDKPNLVQMHVDRLLALEADLNRRYTRS